MPIKLDLNVQLDCFVHLLLDFVFSFILTRQIYNFVVTSKINCISNTDIRNS